MVEKAIAIVTSAVSFCFDMFLNLLDATGTTALWVAGVTFALFVSIILMPFRGGHPVGGGSFGEFLANKISSGKEKARKERERTERAERNRLFRRTRWR